jgi:histidine triad (HIT) family protein
VQQTIFDRILAKEIPANVVFEDDYVLAFRDINPQAPIHVLVIPKRRIARFADLQGQDAAYVGEYIQRVSKVASHLGLDGPGYRVVFNNGKNGGQEVEYIHAHILGNRPMSWPPG